jgi:hypothetical protein
MKKSIGLAIAICTLISASSFADRIQSGEVSCKDFKLDLADHRCKAAACRLAKLNAYEDCVNKKYKKVSVLKTKNDPYYKGKETFVNCDIVYRCKHLMD